MIPLNPALVDWMFGIYLSALREFGVSFPAAHMDVSDDCSFTVMSEDVDQELYAFISQHADLTVIRYEPGLITFIDNGLQEFHDKVGPALRRQIRES